MSYPTVSTQAQQGCDDLRTMVYHSLGVCNDLETRPAATGIITSSAQLRGTPSVPQLNAVPTTQYQLLHYSNNRQQY